MSAPASSQRPGRNDPCPCGSGRKYKHCCGQEAAAPAVRPAAAAPVPSLQDALRRFQAGELGPAEAMFRQILAARPDDANALHLLGLVLHQAGRSSDAVGSIARAVELSPGSAMYAGNLASVLLALGRLDDAAAGCERALVAHPREVGLRNTLGVCRLQQRRLDEARDCFEQVIRLQPGHASAYYNLGLVDLRRGLSVQALAHFERALAIDPKQAQVHNDCGAALRNLGRIDEAVVRFERAAELQPAFAAAHYNLGTTLLEQSRLDEALASLRRCETGGPHAAARLQIATALPAIEDSHASIAAHRDRIARAMAEVTARDITVADPLDAALAPAFFLAYHGLGNRTLQTALARLYLHACPALAWRAPNCGTTRSADGRLRLGFLSAHLRDHTVGDVMQGVITQIDRSRFHVTILRFGPAADEVAQRIDRAADRVVVLEPSLASARACIAEQALDVLVYPEIGMDPATYFLAFGRYAPVQCVMWGHPDTTGIPAIDYYVSAADAEPDAAQDDYSEQLVRLSHISACYARPSFDGALPSVEAYGLPADAHLYICPQTLYKFHPDFDAVLGALLRRDPAGVLVLFHGRSRRWGEQLMARFGRVFPDAVDRVRLLDRLPRQAYLGLLQRAHAVLDTMHFGGGNTSYQALGLVVPIVTWRGGHARGRFTYALYRQMGMTELVAERADDYVALAHALANDPAFRARIVAAIQARSGAIFDNLNAVRELEDFWLSAHASAGAAA